MDGARKPVFCIPVRRRSHGTALQAAGRRVDVVPQLVADGVAGRIAAKDSTLWGEAAEAEASKRLGWIDAAARRDDMGPRSEEPEAGTVQILTIHGSKGLEWDAVFLVGVCETRFPSNRSRTLWTSSPAILPAPCSGCGNRAF